MAFYINGIPKDVKVSRLTKIDFGFIDLAWCFPLIIHPLL